LKGRFKSNHKPNRKAPPLPSGILDPLIGNLLGYGYLQFNKNGLDGKGKRY
jgi:hypothetical protein